MKRKLAAMVLGMAVTLTSFGSVYAAEAEEISMEATETIPAEDAVTESAAVWGEVTSVDEQSITMTTGTLAGTESVEVKVEETDTASVNEEEMVTLIPDEMEMTFDITEDTKVYLLYGNVIPEELERVAAEYAVQEQISEELAEEEQISEELTEEEQDELLTENVESTVYINETDTESILEGDLAGIILDEDGNAGTILIVLPDFEPVELMEEAATDSEEAIEIIEEEVVAE